MIQGFVKIWEPETGHVLVDKKNAIHYENISIAMANALADRGYGFIQEMAFGNGGTTIDSTGIITYLAPNTLNQSAGLHNQTYYKTVNDNNGLNADPARNRLEVRHVVGKKYTDIVVTCTLDYGEPVGQEAFDNATSTSDYVFDELGLKCWDDNTGTNKRLITHVVFHPVQKSLNRIIQVDYTLRIQSFTTFTETA
jgi:hypothetical protein